MPEILELGAVSRVMIARYACAIGDFNPVHLDDEFAKAAGLPSVIAHGPLTGALLLDAIFRVSGRRLTGLDLRFREPVFPGDRLTAIIREDGTADVTDAEGRIKVTAVLREQR